MQGLFIDGQRPASKVAVKRALAEGKAIHVEATSLFGNEYDGDLDELVRTGTSQRIDFVGPDPYTSRKFYGNLVIADGKVAVK